MKTIHAVGRTDISHVAVAFEEADDAQEWIVQSILPDYHELWRVTPIKVYKTFAEYDAEYDGGNQ